MTVTEYLLKHAAAKTAEVSETLRVIKDDCCGYASAEHLKAKTALGDARELLADAARIMAQVQKLLTPNDEAKRPERQRRSRLSALL